MQEDEAFERALGPYVRKFLMKGIPSLFSDLKGLYRYGSRSRSCPGKIFSLTQMNAIVKGSFFSCLILSVPDSNILPRKFLPGRMFS